MDVREKLVELIGSTEYGNGSLVGKNFQKGFIEKIASNLIANGVTVQQWISVKDRLPEKQGFYRVYHKNSKAICDRFYYKDCPDLFVNVKDDPVTHWKPMEQPPKGE